MSNTNILHVETESDIFVDSHSEPVHEQKNELVKTDEPTEPTKSTEPAKPTEPVNNTEHTKDTEPVKTIESVKPAEPVVQEVNLNTKLINDIFNLIANTDELNKILISNALNINPSVLETIKSLSPKSMNIFIDEINKIIDDGKLEAYEIPKLISIIITTLNNTKIKKLEHINVGSLIKFLITLLTHFNVIKLNNNDMKLIYIIIDDTIGLLDVPVRFSKKCCFFF